MIDLGVQVHVVELARQFARMAPQSAPAQFARALTLAADKGGGTDEGAADALNSLYLSLRALDRNADGVLTPDEFRDADLVEELYREIQQNDRKPGKDIPDEPPPSAKPSALAAPLVHTGTVEPAFADLGRRVSVLACWEGRGARYAVDRRRDFIDLAKPDVLLLHTDPVALARGGSELNDYVLGLFPWVRIAWAFYGDSYGPDPSRQWAGCARAAAASKVRVHTLMTDAEVSWKSPKRGDFAQRKSIARASMLAMRNAAPGLHLSFTSYDGPVSIKRPDGKGNWGGHSTFPWEGFEGEGSPIDAEASQVYVGHTLEDPATMATALNRLARYELSRAAAVKDKWIKATMEPWMYLQVHGCRTGAICALAETKRVFCGWASSMLDPRGMDGFRMAAELARRNMTVKEFQKSEGLEVDGNAGDLARARLLG